MPLKCGIVGLPNVGKSTLFNCLSSAKAQAANFPFCTIEPNIGTITVPDQRLEDLTALIKPKSVVPTTVEIVDIAGLVKGASRGEGLGNQFLANIRDTQAILHVVRCFEDENVVHVDGRVNPVADKEIIDYELQIKDLESVDKRIPKAEKLAKTGDKLAARMLSGCLKIKDALEAGLPARSVELTPEELTELTELNLITLKPVLYVANVDEASVSTGNVHSEALRAAIEKEGAEMLILCVKIESEIAEITDAAERQELLQMYGLKESGVVRLIQSAYHMLNLITYFTAGEKEVRAWTVTRGAKAPKAAGEIHTDFEKGFIRAEVIQLDDFLRLGSEAACKEVGKMAVEGKEYVVRDGDIMHFRFNV